MNGKRNGKGKEYYQNGQLKFEGEYLHSHKLSGLEYINGNVFYEGEYLYDKKWNGKSFNGCRNFIIELKNGTGKVKEYYHTGNLEFEREYLNGKRNGKGKEYWNDGKLMFNVNI